jgi:hypothetical protein
MDKEFASGSLPELDSFPFVSLMNLNYKIAMSSLYSLLASL